MSDAIEIGKPAYIDRDQYIAKVVRKEKDAKRPGYRRKPWNSAALLRFPDNRRAMVDLGPPRAGLISPNSGRTAIDFLKWIALQDNNWRFEGADADNPFHLDWVAISHPDEDHFGAGREMLDRLGTWWSIGAVYHCGVGRYRGVPARKWRAASGGQGRVPGFSQLGVVDGHSESELYLTSLFDHFGDVGRLRKTTANRDWTLTGSSYATFIGGLWAHRGAVVGRLKRLSHRSDAAALRTGGVRILLTGDLNFKSQALIQKQWDDEELRCDVAKACHHGSEDISWRFLQKMSPIATMFSSGDQETHVHPRALVLGLSGALSPLMQLRTEHSPVTGPDQRFQTQRFDGFSEEKIFAPLLYSTELSRSVRLRSDMKPYSRAKNDAGEWEYEKLSGVYVKGGRKDDAAVHLSQVRIADQLTYGLINVRTDRDRVLMAVMEEGDQTNPRFHCESFRPADLVRLAV